MPTFLNETSLSEVQVINFIRTAVEKQFPKICSPCGHRFYTFKEYLQNTDHIGQPHSYDAEIQDWRPNKPLGALAYAKCKFCKNTMATSLFSLEVETMWQLLSWIKEETSKRGVSSSDILNDLKVKITNQVLNEGLPFRA
jgi:hypothetical protein